MESQPNLNRSDSDDMSVCSDMAVYNPIGVRNVRKNLVDLEAKKRIAKEKFEEDVKKRMIQMRKESTLASTLPISNNPSAFKLPTRQRDLPTTREGFHALSNAIKANGGPHIGVYAGASVANIKKNFIRKLNLNGLY